MVKEKYSPKPDIIEEQPKEKTTISPMPKIPMVLSKKPKNPLIKKGPKKNFPNFKPPMPAKINEQQDDVPKNSLI